MVRVIACLSLTAVLCCAASLQFEAADVHASARTTNPGLRKEIVRDRYTLRTATMVDLIRIAYSVDESNVVGGPTWLEMDRYDITAKLPADARPDAVPAMLQALLAERFKLAVHQDTKSMPAYVVTAGKKLLLKPAAEGPEKGCKSVPSGSQAIAFAYSCHNVPMADFVASLPDLARPYVGATAVSDQTELKGGWDFDLKFSRPVQLSNFPGEAISLTDAMDKQLGLKIEQRQVSLPVVVVDSVNERPTDNPPGVTEKLPPLPTEFEVAEIKLSAPGTQENMRIQPGGRINASGITLKDLVEFAWDLDDDDQVSGPHFMDEARFDIVAKAQNADQADNVTLGLMVRALLTDRFKLTTHFEDHPVAVYALLAVKPKMKTADPANRSSCKSAGTIGGQNAAVFRNFVCQNASMAQLVDKLRAFAPGYIDHPVVDLTGLNGSYDFNFSFSGVAAFRASGDAGASSPNGAISLFEAVDKQLGLKLEVQKHAMPVLVIDHIEQKPTDN